MIVNGRTFKPGLIANRIKLVASFMRGKTFAGGFPVGLAIEVTNRCNANCIMCARNDMKRLIGDMSLDVFKKIIDEVRVYNELVWLHLAGEPLLHPGISEMISYAKSRGINVGLSTNAISLDDKKSREIINSGLDLLVISFDGAVKETYEKIRKLSNYERTLNNILNYLKLKAKAIRAPHTQIQCIYMDENKGELNKFLKLWRHTAADAVRFKPFFRFPSKEEAKEVVIGQQKRTKPCVLLWRQFSIYWDGTVVSCCWDFLGQTPLGNVMDKSLAEIWNGPKMQFIREKHIKGEYKEIALCRNCNIPQIGIPYLLGSLLIDDLSVKKLLPFFDNLSSLFKIKSAKYYK